MKTELQEIDRNIYDIKNKDEYDFKIKKGLTREIIEEISECKRQFENIERQIANWRSQQSSLGFFKGKEKRALQAQIDEAQSNLNAIPTQSEIQAKHQPTINQINADKKAAIERIASQVQSQYTMPNLEDFAEEAAK